MVVRNGLGWVVLGGVAGLMTAGSASAASACAASPPVLIALSVEAGAVGGTPAARFEVSVHEDGCVAVHRPWFLRDAGTYESRLGTDEQRTLLDLIDIAALRSVDQSALDAETESQQRAANGVRYTTIDADRRVLQWRDGDRLRTLTYVGEVDAAADRSGAVASATFVRAARALQALAQRDGQRIDTGSAP
jgi:hypothetical protein